MRTEITAVHHNQLCNSDLSEMFEMFVGQSAYLEVLNVHDDSIEGTYETKIIGELSEFEPGTFCNVSYWFDDKHRQYAIKKGLIKSTFFIYDTPADAAAHAAELLQGLSTPL